MNADASEEYQLKWESRSSVRTRPRKPIDFSLSGDFFPMDRHVLFLLPEVCALEDKKKDILLLSFLKYLNDIIQLETHFIYGACHSIMHRDMPVAYADVIKRNASTVIIDEYYHVYIAYDLLSQLRGKYSHLPHLDSHFSDATQAMETIKETLPKKYHDIFEIVAVCIFETTLIRELVTYFDSATIHPSIKYYINDHMNDESRHFGFFYELLCYTWANMPEGYRQNIGSKLGEFVTLYLNVKADIEHNTCILSWALDDPEKAKGLVEKLYHGFNISPDLPIVKNVLRVLTQSGVLSHEAVQQSFVSYALIAQG
ncbi:MAG: diiron oxygenase [Legionellaceae bacterium]|nr:diiron oxygenase [Legionellaceae bacterium]